MKKLSILVFFFAALLFSSSTMAQSTDYFVGDWEVQIKDTPMGTITVILTLERVDGKLVGKFVDNASGTETKMNEITETDNGLNLNFTSEYGDLQLSIQPAGETSIVGLLMDSFTVEGKKIEKTKEIAVPKDFFVGDWEVQIKDTPMGTITVVLTLERVDGKLVGKFVDNASGTETKMNEITETDNGLNLNFTSEYGDLQLSIQPAGETSIVGLLMDSFTVEGKKIEKTKEIAVPKDFFVGDWEVQIKDTPMGTITVVLTLERVDGKLVGKFVDHASGTETKMNEITESETSLTLNFTSEYGDLYLTLLQEDDENVSGSLMDSFAVEGKRVKK